MRLLNAAAALLASHLGAQAEYADTLRFVQGQEIPCEVQRITCRDVTVQVNDAGAAYPSERIEAIVWDLSSVPASMSAGRRHFAEGSFAEAAMEFEAAAESTRTRLVMRQECSFMAAESHRLACQFAPGVVGYRKLLAAWPDSYYFRRAVAGLVACLTRQDPPRWAEAHRELAAWIVHATREMNWDAEIADEMKLEDARLYEREGLPAKALPAYTDLARLPASPIAWAAQAGVGSCELAQGQIAKAEAAFRKVLEGASPLEVGALRRAWNGLGECAIGGEAKSEKELKNALLCFLRTVIVYPPDPGELSEDHRRALLSAARCCHALSTLEPMEGARLEYARQYQKLREIFGRLYGGRSHGWEKRIEEPF
ncbi:MAG: hypothetical protein HYY18_10970 [Planctomycetes bacterium]|nr:hypothetical protein [Planctomycetota bacterium]